MPFTRPTLAELRDRIRQDFGARLPGADALLRQSNLRVIADVLAELSNAQFDYETWLAGQLFPDTCETVFLDRWASIWGVDREPAAFAVGTLTVTGTPGAVVPESATWQRSDNVLYDADAAATIGAGGTAAVPVTASVAGAAGNAAPNTQVQAVTTATGVQRAAMVAEPGLAGGADVETDEHLRARLLLRIQLPPQGGSASDYVEWALEVPGVTRAWVYPQEFGAGTVVVRFMMDDVRAPDGFPTPADVAIVQAHLDLMRPVTAQVYVLAPLPLPVNVTVQDLFPPDRPDVQAAANAELVDTFRRNAIPGATIYVSWLWEAVSVAVGERHHHIIVPPGDVVCPIGYLAVLGTVTYVP
jgi:uncharacterized phage protein gp47/JayE